MLSFSQDVLQKLLKDPEIQQCRLRREEDEEVTEGQMTSKQGLQLTSANQKAIESASQNESSTNAGEQEGKQVPEDIFDFYEKMDKEEEEETELKTVSCEINQEYLETLQRRLGVILISYQTWYFL